MYVTFKKIIVKVSYGAFLGNLFVCHDTIDLYKILEDN